MLENFRANVLKDCSKLQRLRLLRDSDLPGFVLTEGIQNVDIEASLVSCLCLEDIRVKKILKKNGSILNEI